MANKYKDLFEKRSTLIVELRQLAEADELGAEDQEKFDKIKAEIRGINDKIKRMQEVTGFEEELRQAGLPGPLAGQSDDPTPPTPNDADKYFERFIRYGQQTELRNLQADSDPAGGYLITPKQFVKGIIKGIDDTLYLRGLATIHTLEGATSLGMVTLENDPSDPDWTPELKSGSKDEDMEFGERELNPHLLSKMILVSERLLRHRPDIVNYVQERLAYKFSTTLENVYMNGNGVRKPLGIFVPSADGISTKRDISTGNTPTAVTFDGLTRAKFNLKPHYRSKATWIFHTDLLVQIALIKDKNDNYIWRESTRQGEPGTILGINYLESAYAPSDISAGKYVGILGYFKNYHIVDSLSMQIKWLGELYTETNQIGLKAQMETDGQPVLEEAFTRIKLPTA